MLLNRATLTLIATLGSAALLGGAFAFQYIGGLAPCQLCLWQRWPHAAAILIDALGEPPLLLASGPVPPVGRWGSGAVVVVLGDDHARTAVSAVEGLAPRLIAVAGDDTAVEAVLAAVGGRLDGTGFMALEPGLALAA